MRTRGENVVNRAWYKLLTNDVKESGHAKPIFEDSSGCRDIACQNGSVSRRAKHIDVKHNFVQSNVALGTTCAAVVRHQ